METDVDRRLEQYSEEFTLQLNDPAMRERIANFVATCDSDQVQRKLEKHYDRFSQKLRMIRHVYTIPASSFDMLHPDSPRPPEWNESEEIAKFEQLLVLFEALMKEFYK